MLSDAGTPSHNPVFEEATNGLLSQRLTVRARPRSLPRFCADLKPFTELGIIAEPGPFAEGPVCFKTQIQLDCKDTFVRYLVVKVLIFHHSPTR